MDGKLANDADSPPSVSSCDLNQSSARSMAAIASGMVGENPVAVSAVSGSSTPPGTTHAGWMRLPPSHSMICWPNWRRRMPSRASCGLARSDPEDVALARDRRPCRAADRATERWKKLSACDCTIWARFMMRRRRAGRRGSHRQDRVAGLGGGDQVADRADAADARHERRHLVRTAGPRRIFEAAELRHVELGVFDLARFVQVDGDLASGLRCG